MQTVNKGGDVLARGNVRCQFPPAGGSVSDKQWEEMWKNEDGTDFDPEAYKKGEPKDENAVKAEGKSNLGR